MYSQYDEEFHILQAFDHRDGRFLDVGAYHPTEKSNTRALFELGWSGVMVEPSPGPMKALLKEYGNEPRITLIQACVAIEPGLVNLNVSDDAVSTSDAGVHETWKEAGGYFGTMLVPGITLESIANQFGGFDFINFDAEGCSVDLLQRMLALEWGPRCVCCETDGREAEIISTASSRYNVVYGNGTNILLVRK